MADPERALAEQAREELGIAGEPGSPMREAWITGTATALGAFIPVAPFLVSTGRWAIWTSFALAMLSHFAVGAARSVFTGRGVFRSGMDMFVVGLGVAAVGYVVGEWIVRMAVRPLRWLSRYPLSARLRRSSALDRSIRAEDGWRS